MQVQRRSQVKAGHRHLLPVSKTPDCGWNTTHSAGVGTSTPRHRVHRRHKVVVTTTDVAAAVDDGVEEAGTTSASHQLERGLGAEWDPTAGNDQKAVVPLLAMRSGETEVLVGGT